MDLFLVKAPLTLAVFRNEENTHSRTRTHTRTRLLPQSSNMQTRAFGGVSCTCCRKWTLYGRLKKQAGHQTPPLGPVWSTRLSSRVQSSSAHWWRPTSVRNQSVVSPAASGPSEGAEPQGKQTSDGSQRVWIGFASPIPLNMNKKPINGFN